MSTTRRRLFYAAIAALFLATVLACRPNRQQPGAADAETAEPSGENSTDSGTPDGDRLFDPGTIATARLRLTADQWTAMEPKGGTGPFGGPGGPGPGPGGPPPGAGDFGPGNFVAPVFLEQGDTDHDSRLSLEEMRKLADRWFTTADKQAAGTLTRDQLRDGLNVALAPKGPPPGIGGPPGNMFKAAEGKRNGIAGVMGIDFPWAQGDFEFLGRTFHGIDVRWKGNGTFLQSRGELKRSFKVKLPKDATGGIREVNFHSNVTDASWMNEVLSYRLYRDAGVPAPRTGYARVYLTVPGKYDNTYLGLYATVENIDKHFARDRFGTKKGAIFKPVARRMFDDLGDDWKSYRQVYDPKTAVSGEETRRVIAFCKLVSHASDEEFAAKLERFLDLEEFSRFMAVTVWLSTLDSLLAMDQNVVLYLHPETHRFLFIPWDLDHSFGQFFPMGTPQQRENLSIHKPWTGEFAFLRRVFGIEPFKRRYQARLKELNETLGQPDRLHRQVDELAQRLRPAVAEESAEKLARFDKVVAGEAVGPAGFGGGFAGPSPKAPPGQGPPPGFPGMFSASVKPIKGFVTARHQSVRDQLEGVKAGEQIGGFGFGPAPPGAPGGPKPPEPPAGFGPGMFWALLLLGQFDLNKDGRLARAELVEGFQRWFQAWDVDKTGALSEPQLRAGLNKVFAPPGPGGGPGAGPFGPGLELGPLPLSDPDFESPDEEGLDLDFGLYMRPQDSTTLKKPAGSRTNRHP